MLKLISQAERTLKNHYLFIVAVFAVLLFVFYKYWLLTTILTSSYLVFIRPYYWIDRSRKFKLIFDVGINNIITDILLFININFSMFLTCLSFALIDLIIFSLTMFKNNFKGKQ